MGEHAGFAHAHGLGDGADGQAFQPDLRGHAQGGVDDGRLGLLPLGQRGRPARRGHNGIESGYGMGHGNQKRTIVLF